MKFQRVELHNHTTHSDGYLSVEELLKLAKDRNFETIAITDHNTISTFEKVDDVLKENSYNLNIVKGVEITTAYGHIVALGMEDMCDFSQVNIFKVEQLFRKLKENGAVLVGIAHPFVVGRPITNGCRFQMKINDYLDVDYIEIYNGTYELGSKMSKFIGNEEALEYWEKLFLSGVNVAATSGKDIHKFYDDEDIPITFVEDYGLSRTENLYLSIKEIKSQVTRGPRIIYKFEGCNLKINFDNSSNYMDWNLRYKDYKYILTISSLNSTREYSIDSLDEEFIFNCEENRLTLRLYIEDKEYSNLVLMGIGIRGDV